MVSRDEMLRIARCHDTVVSLAFLRALGCGRDAKRPRRRKRGRDGHRAGERAKYKGMLQCFRNPTSPMDWH